MAKILVLGNHGIAQIIHVNRFPEPGETIPSCGYEFPQDSGKGGNQAMALGLLGASVAFIGKVGDDRIGRLGERWMKERNVDTSGLIISETMSTPQGVIIVDQHGQNIIINGFRGEDYLSFEEIEPLLRAHPDAEFFLSNFEVPIPLVEKSLAFAKDRGLHTVLNPSPYPVNHEFDFANVDFAIFNELEAKQASRVDINKEVPIEELSKLVLKSTGAPNIIITLGENGLFGTSRGSSWAIPGVPVNVVDTIGAGDAFLGGLVWGLAEGNDLKEASIIGNFLASMSVSSKGSFPSYPQKSEFVNAYKQYRSETDLSYLKERLK